MQGGGSSLLGWTLGAALALSALWGALFIRFQHPGGALALWGLETVWALTTLAAFVALWRGPRIALAVYAIAFLALVVWYVSVRPTNDRDWALDVSRPLTSDIGPQIVTVHDVRDFEWRRDDDFTSRWREERYDLSQLESVDLINSYWSGPAIAHTILSFGFGGGRYLDLSVEVRRLKGAEYSNVAGFFKVYELVFVAAEERDIVRVRSNVRHENVQLFRVKATPDQIRTVFVDLLRRANDVAERPAFYATLDRNCTTEIFGAVRKVAPDLPLDWRIIVSGYLPDYAYDQGVLDTRVPLSELRTRGEIGDRARAADADPNFSTRVRVGIPDPNDG